jgi:hypothetical protein
VTRLNSFLNRTLVNKQLFGGTILSISFNLSAPALSNTTDSIDDDHSNAVRTIMTERTSNNDQLSAGQPTRTTFTTVTYTTLEKGLSITISETITITNNNNDTLPVNNKNYEVILIPTIDNTKTAVVTNGVAIETTSQTPLLPSLPLLSTTTRTTAKSSSQQDLLCPVKSTSDASFAYIDESSDDRTMSSVDGSILMLSFSCVRLLHDQ